MLIVLLSPELGSKSGFYQSASFILYILTPLISKNQFILDFEVNVTQGFFLLIAVNTKP